MFVVVVGAAALRCQLNEGSWNEWRIILEPSLKCLSGNSSACRLVDIGVNFIRRGATLNNNSQCFCPSFWHLFTLATRKLVDIYTRKTCYFTANSFPTKNKLYLLKIHTNDNDVTVFSDESNVIIRRRKSTILQPLVASGRGRDNSRSFTIPSIFTASINIHTS